MFFFFMQKTAYGLRISDWSSDVCSSDLLQDIAGYEGELLSGNGTVVLYLLDHETDKPVDTAGMQASILFTEGEARKGTVALKAAGDRLEGAGKVPPGADAVVSLRTKGGKTAQARFELGGHEH